MNIVVNDDIKGGMILCLIRFMVIVRLANHSRLRKTAEVNIKEVEDSAIFERSKSLLALQKRIL